MSETTKTTIKHPAMGAIPGATGVTFRVQAPHAEEVYVTGTFNDQSEISTPLARDENDYWSTDVPEATTGDEYRYLIHGPNGPLSHIDLYARKTNSISWSNGPEPLFTSHETACLFNPSDDEAHVEIMFV